MILDFLILILGQISAVQKPLGVYGLSWTQPNRLRPQALVVTENRNSGRLH